jgi:hypothetical protein
VPTIGASIAASVVTWVLDDLISPHVSLFFRIMINLVVSILVFYRARRALVDLRGR